MNRLPPREATGEAPAVPTIPLLPAAHDGGGFGPKRGHADWMQAYSVYDYLAQAPKRWFLLASTTAFGLGCGVLAAWYFPDQYRSAAQIRFLPPQVADRFVPATVALHADQRVSALTQWVGSSLVAGRLIDRLNLYPWKRNKYPTADLIEDFSSSVVIANRGSIQARGQQLPTISVQFDYPNAEQARDVVQQIVEMVYEENQRFRGDQTIGVSDFLAKQAQAAAAELQAVEAQLEELGTVDTQSQLKRTASSSVRLNGIQRQLTYVRDRARDVKFQREQAEYEIQALTQRREEVLRMDSAPPVSASGEALRVKMSDAADQLDKVRSRYREGHPDRELAERRYRSLENEVRRSEQRERGSYLTNQLRLLDDRLAVLRGKMKGFTESITIGSAEEQKLLADEQALLAQQTPLEQAEFRGLGLKREYEVLRDRHKDLLQKQRQAETATEMERRGQGETVELIEPPSLPSRARMPNYLVKIGAGFCGGLALGIGLVLALFLRRPRVQSARNLEYIFQAPLLGDFPLVPAPRPPGGRKIRIVISTASLVMLLGCSQSATELYGEARKAAAAGNHGTARLLYRKAIKADPKFGLAYRDLANYAIESRKWGEARGLLLRAVELLGDDPSVKVRLAELSYQEYFGDPSRPQAVLRDVEELARSLIRQYPGRNDGYRLAAQVLLERRHWDEAVGILERGLEVIEGDPSLRTQLASAHHQAGNSAEALRILNEVVSAGVKYAPAYDLLYLQQMGRRELRLAGQVLEAKWRAVANLDAGLQWAAHHHAMNDLAAAQGVLDDVADKFTTEPLVALRIGDFWLNRGDLGLARRWYESGWKQYPSASSHYAGRLAELLAAENREDEAHRLLAQELVRRPGDVVLEAHQAALGIEDPRAEAAQQARSRLEAILSRMPDSAFVRYHLGRSYLRQGEFQKAGELFEQSVSLDPNYAPGWLALAEASMATGEYAKAAAGAEMLLSRSPGLRAAMVLRARSDLARNRIAEAAQVIEQMLEADPADRSVRMLAGELRWKQGRIREAEAVYREVVRDEPGDGQALLALAAIEASRGKADSAMTRAREAEAAAGNDASVRFPVANLALRLGKAEEAFSRFNDLAARYPMNLEYRLGLANTMATMGRQAEAGEQYAKAREISGKDPRPWLLHAALMSESGSWEFAARGYQEVLNRQPDHPIALNNLAYILAATGKELPRAQQLAERAQRVMPDSPEITDTIAYVYLKKGMPRNAISLYERLLDRTPPAGRRGLEERVARLRSGNWSAVLAEIDGKLVARGYPIGRTATP